MELDRNNNVFFQAADYILKKDSNNSDIVFLTGKAGTGKTTFLKYIIDNYKGIAVVLAPTGVAAINARGQTIHSFFCLKPPFFYPPDSPDLLPPKIYEHLAMRKEKRELIEKLELLIIDEVSMVRCELLDSVDRILKVYRHNNKPFGGVKVLLVGDVFQLPPVTPPDEWIQLKDYYDSCYFFSSNAYKNASVAFFELDKVYRQDRTEILFTEALNHIRNGNVRGSDIQLLNTRVGLPENNDSCIELMTMNAPAANHNQSKYDCIHGPEVTFRGVVTGEFDVKTMSNVDEFISLKVGAQVMTMRNCYDQEGRFLYYNGSIGIVTALAQNAGWLEVCLAESGQKVIVTPYKWENIIREYDEETDLMIEKVVGSFTQIPIRLAWAITIHKSQGLTFDRASINLSGTFAHGQAYVALSRCRRLSGLYLRHSFEAGVSITDPLVEEFYQKLKSDFQKIKKEAEMTESLYRNALAFFMRGDALSAIDCFYHAQKVSNYLTDGIHRNYSKKANTLSEKYQDYKKAAKLVKDLQRDNEQLHRDCEESGKTIERINSENTQLMANCENMQKRIDDLELEKKAIERDNIAKKNTIRRQKEELQEMKQLFIEKTIELDNIRKTPFFKRIFKIGW